MQAGKNKKPIATMVSKVFTFPDHPAAMTCPLCAATKRTPDTVNSLNNIIAIPHIGTSSNETEPITTILFCINNIKKEMRTNILSARGSANFPNVVISLYFLARKPSKKSVQEAKAKMIKLIKFA